MLGLAFDDLILTLAVYVLVSPAHYVIATLKFKRHGLADVGGIDCLAANRFT
jgi:hypothetical protein